MGKLVKHRVGAVSYLNTVPLVWGMLHGPEREKVELSFFIPSECARQVEEGAMDIGLVPIAEIARQGLEIVPDVGIACFGPVRSILLFSRVPWARVRTLAADLSSRTSVELAKIIFRERYGIEPKTFEMQPLLDEMLMTTDAALIIGDPALRIDPDKTDMEWMDLGAEWFSLTQLPMVFAAWAGKPGIPVEQLSAVTRDSYSFGRSRLGEIIDYEHRRRSVGRDLASRYLREHIRFEIGAAEQQGLQAFLELARLKEASLAQRA